MCEGFLRSPALVSHTSATGSAGLCGLWRGSVLADTPPAAQVPKGWQTKKQTKSCTLEGTANEPLLSNGSLHPPNARGGHLCVICGQVFWLKRQTSFPAFPGKPPVTFLENTPLTQQRHCAGFTPASLLCARESAPTYPFIHFMVYAFIIRFPGSIVKRVLPVLSAFLPAVPPRPRGGTAPA